MGSSVERVAASAAALRLEFGRLRFPFADDGEDDESGDDVDGADDAAAGVDGFGFDDSTIPLVSVFGAADAAGTTATAGGGVETAGTADARGFGVTATAVDEAAAADEATA